MRSETLGSVVRRLRQAVAPPPPPHPAAPRPDGPDAELVRAFAFGRDPAAFESIVRRHGPMVLGVCRRVLRDPADAEDAFQATFLVLVRRARSLRQPDRLAGWLHQVAQRTARKLRATRLARARREGELFDVPAGEPVAEFVWRELRPIFDQELGRLPDKLRLPAVLCFLEGHSKGEAARTLGWSEGTLAGRLQQAREKLRVRFAARGLTLSAGALAVALFEGAGSAAVSDRLIASTLQAAATGPAGATCAGAWALADGVTQAMWHTKMKAVAAGVLAAGLVGTGTGVVLIPGSGPGEVAAGQTKDGPPKATPSAPAQAAPAARPDSRRPAADRARDPDRAALEAELDLLKERAAWEEQMVRKGFMTEAQVRKTKLEVAKAEAELARRDAPKAPDPRRAALEEIIKKAEEIAAKTAEGVRRQIVPEQELLNTQMRVLDYKLKLAELDDRPAPERKPVEARRAAIEEAVRQLEEIVAKTAEGVRRGIVPQQELLNAQMKVLDYKLKLAELEPRPVPEPPAERGAAARPRGAAAARPGIITQKESELRRAEALLKQNAISQEEVRRLRIDLAGLKAEAAEAGGDYAAAVKLRDEVVAEWEAIAAATKRLAGGRAVAREELRAVEVAVAEARVGALKAAVLRQLAEIVRIRERELAEAKTLFEAKAVSAEEVRKAEQALNQARLRLAEER